MSTKLILESWRNFLKEQESPSSVSKELPYDPEKESSASEQKELIGTAAIGLLANQVNKGQYAKTDDAVWEELNRYSKGIAVKLPKTNELIQQSSGLIKSNKPAFDMAYKIGQNYTTKSEWDEVVAAGQQAAASATPKKSTQTTPETQTGSALTGKGTFANPLTPQEFETIKTKPARMNDAYFVKQPNGKIVRFNYDAASKKWLGGGI